MPILSFTLLDYYATTRTFATKRININMPKRKATSADLSRVAPPSLSSLDAALDLLAHETFDRLQTLTSKFEAAAGVKLNDGVVKARWEEAVKRYWVMKSMDDLCCSVNGTGPGVTLEDSPGSDDAMRDDSASVSAAASTSESGKFYARHTAHRQLALPNISGPYLTCNTGGHLQRLG